MRIPSLTYKNLLLAVTLFFVLLLPSCSDDDLPYTPLPTDAEETLFMYMPWSGDNIYKYFLNNITSFETAIENNLGLGQKRFMVFISTSGTNAHLIDISYDNGICVRDTLKNYSFSEPSFTTASGIASILEDMMAAAPAKTYSMAIGCHGMGWIPKGVEGISTYNLARRMSGDVPQTRYFGHSSDSKYQTDITTLASGIKLAGITMEYILFDDCYMSNIETAYDLREVTTYLIASTSEIMIEGMPYAVIGKSLLDHDYRGVCEGFYDYYSTYSTPCGTIGVTDCRETEAMVSIMRDINTLYPDGVSDISDIQTLDGYSPTIFFDFGDYVSHLCEDEALFAVFTQQLEQLVPYKACTATYYSQYTGRQKAINAFSGLTISDPSQNSMVTTAKKETDWYNATRE